MPAPSGASVSGLCDSLIKAGGSSPMAAGLPEGLTSRDANFWRMPDGRFARRHVAVRRRAVFVLAVDYAPHPGCFPEATCWP
jgi:hypothetical protein